MVAAAVTGQRPTITARTLSWLSLEQARVPSGIEQTHGNNEPG